MDMWILFQDRYVVIIFFIVIIVVSVLSLYAIWKRRTDIRKFISLTLAAITVIIIIAALYGLVFTFLFGYNS